MRGRLRLVLLAAAGIGALATSGAQAASAPAQSSEPADTFTFAAVGDLLGPYGEALPKTSGVAEVGKILAAADASFANQEGSAVDPATFTGSLGAENGGGYPNHTFKVIRAFKDMGISLLSRANNHATDYGLDGMIATDRALDAIGLVHAGTGRTLEEARKPAYYDSAKGRVSLVATASSFTGMSPAGDSERGFSPRAGLNPLHVDPITLVNRQELSALRAIALRGGWQGQDLPDEKSTDFYVGETRYRLSDTPGLTYSVKQSDQDAIVKSVVEAKRNSRFVTFSIHAHETLSGGIDDFAPAEFLPALFHAAIDAGADVVVRHGPHSVAGIEIYHGKPIFYGLGSLVADLPKNLKIATSGPEPLVITLPDIWFESAVAVTKYQAGRLKSVEITPLMLNTADGAERGLPRVAHGPDAQRILARIQNASKQFGTVLQIKGDIGIVQISQ